MCDNKGNGPEDAVVSEMIKQLPLKKIYGFEICGTHADLHYSRVM